MLSSIYCSAAPNLSLILFYFVTRSQEFARLIPKWPFPASTSGIPGVIGIHSITTGKDTSMRLDDQAVDYQVSSHCELLSFSHCKLRKVGNSSSSNIFYLQERSWSIYAASSVSHKLKAIARKHSFPGVGIAG